jgi:iron complex transport system ATP-binding protein
LLRGGRVLAAGRIEEVLADAPLSRCFEMPIVVDREGGRWRARAGTR